MISSKIILKLSIIGMFGLLNLKVLPQNNPNRKNLIIWDYNCDSIINIAKLRADTLTYQKLINIINDRFYGKIFLEFENISHDTIFVKINDSEYLTERMGTCGANGYMISTTFTLTEIREIRFVSFDFEIGDHATPGTYSRNYYFDWIENNKIINRKDIDSFIKH